MDHLHDDDVPPDESAAPMLPSIQRTPPVWPVFVTYALMFAAYIALQFALLIAWAVWQLVNGANPEQMANDLMGIVATPEGLTILATGSQLAIGISAVIGAWFLRQPIRASLGLGKPAVPVWSYPIVIIGVAAPGGVGAYLALALAEIIPADETLDKICGELTWTNGPLFIAFLSLVPGFVEELFFRGYMQRRLLQAWVPWQAILVTSALFAVLHLAPHQVVFAFFIGLWLGVIGWRTGSIWACMLAHAFWNACSISTAVALKKLGLEDDPPLILGVIAGVIALICFAASIWLFRRPPPPIIAMPETPQAALEDTQFEAESRPFDGDAFPGD